MILWFYVTLFPKHTKTWPQVSVWTVRNKILEGNGHVGPSCSAYSRIAVSVFFKAQLVGPFFPQAFSCVGNWRRVRCLPAVQTVSVLVSFTILLSLHSLRCWRDRYPSREKTERRQWHSFSSEYQTCFHFLKLTVPSGQPIGPKYVKDRE